MKQKEGFEFNPQKNISLLQYGRRFFVYSSNMAAVTSCEHTLYWLFFVSFTRERALLCAR